MNGHLIVGPGRNPAQRWCVLHATTGRIVLRGYRGRATAARELNYLAGLADWSRPIDELLADPVVRERMQVEQVRVLNREPLPAS